MTRKKQVLALAAILALLGAWWAAGQGADDDSTGSVATVDGSARSNTSSRVRVPHSELDDASQVEPLDEEIALTAGLTVRVECEPEGAEVAWTAELYREPTESSRRQLVATKTAVGSQSFEWAAPAGAVGVRVVSRDAFGDPWVELELSAGGIEDAADCVAAFRLFANARVSGHVRDEHGGPVQGARLVLAPRTDLFRRTRDPVGPGREPTTAAPVQSAMTDEKGAYVVEGVDPRRVYDCGVAHPIFSVAREYGLAPVAGGETVQDFVLRPGGQVRGRLLDSELRPIAGARLRAATATHPSSALIKWHDEGSSVSDDHGRFAFGSLGPGWKKIETIASVEPGLTVVGHWELEVDRGDSHDLGDLVVGLGHFEARITAPEGSVPPIGISVHFVASKGVRTEGAAAMILIPVLPDDDMVIRIAGLPAGTVSATVRETEARGDGRHRPRSDFGMYHDGDRTSVEWMLRFLEAGDVPSAAVDTSHAQVNLEFGERTRGDVAFIWVDGELRAASAAHKAGLSVAARLGAQIRVAVTDGDRYTEEEFRLEGDFERNAFRAGDRPGREMTIRVVDDGRGVPDVRVYLGSVVDALPVFGVGQTDRSGTLTLRGLPPGVDVVVAAHLGRDFTKSVRPKWIAGKAEVLLDASQD